MLTRRTDGPVEMTNFYYISERRVRPVMTAWPLSFVAAAIFIAFILSGVLGS